MGKFKDCLIYERETMLPYFCMLAMVQNIGNVTYDKLCEHFDSPKEIFETEEPQLNSLGILSKGQMDALIKTKMSINPERYYAELTKQGIGFVSVEDDAYPARLLDIPSRPIGLFYCGSLPDENIPTAGVIGARECSFYGEEAAGLIGGSLGGNGIQVISGMARGIDSLSQLAALDAGGRSFAVLGGGVDICYPRESRRLYDRLKEQGGIISEYAPGVAPLRTFFIRRNRIISGLSDVLCVVEAKKKSGTLTTVDCALEQGRDVFCVPGRITDKTSAGCNELIRQGAEILSDPEQLSKDILERWGLKPMPEAHTAASESASKLNYIEKLILARASTDSFVPDELLEYPEIREYSNAFELLTVCTMLSYDGYLVNMGGGRFRKSVKQH
ncbi:MAG: DNA-processing protein DprA [Lachnospiraceae bacterium]|nr:DNA-processing protein DprA [Lachnospiraceae bacterium]